MTEEIESNPEVWDRLFPDSERRALAMAYVEKVAKIDGVERIVSLNHSDVDKEGVHVIVRGKNDDSREPDEKAFDDVLEAHDEICVDERLTDLLGGPRVFTEIQFTDLSGALSKSSNPEITSLWTKSQPVDVNS